MESISIGGRPVSGFALGQPVGVGAGSPGVSPAFAAVMAGTTVGLLAYVLKAPLWGAVVAAAGTAMVTDWGINKAAA